LFSLVKTKTARSAGSFLLLKVYFRPEQAVYVTQTIAVMLQIFLCESQALLSL
jgi:hypothetical protein